jgi:hypothetical protein
MPRPAKPSSIVARVEDAGTVGVDGLPPRGDSRVYRWTGRITASSKGALARCDADDGKLINPGRVDILRLIIADARWLFESARSAKTPQTHDPRISSSAISDSGKTCPPSTTKV